jgi:hypothetical protein
MRKSIVILLSTLSLVSGTAFANWAVTRAVDGGVSQYPGAVRTEHDNLELSLAQGELTRQAEFRTMDDLAAVTAWYAAQWAVDPASDNNLLRSGDCVWLAQSKPAWLFSHSFSAVACALTPGTSIVVNDNVYLWP